MSKLDPVDCSTIIDCLAGWNIGTEDDPCALTIDLGLNKLEDLATKCGLKPWLVLVALPEVEVARPNCDGCKRVYTRPFNLNFYMCPPKRKSGRGDIVTPRELRVARQTFHTLLTQIRAWLCPECFKTPVVDDDGNLVTDECCNVIYEYPEYDGCNPECSLWGDCLHGHEFIGVVQQVDYNPFSGYFEMSVRLEETYTY